MRYSAAGGSRPGVIKGGVEMKIGDPAPYELSVLAHEPCASTADGRLGEDLILALSQDDPFVPSIYCYDDRGSSLFEERCRQPEYYLRRLELAILEARLTDIIELAGPVDVVELGCGNSIKTALIIRACHASLARAHPQLKIVYSPIDINRNALEEGVASLLQQFPFLEVQGFIGNYDDGLRSLASHPSDKPRMHLFLGSTVGNLDDEQLDTLLISCQNNFNAGDFLLLGADLLKDPRVLERAYDDSAGVGRAMELNALIHVNQLFDGDFDPDLFHYKACFESDRERVAARLYSKCDQRVTLRRLNFVHSLRKGDSLRIGNMRKFRVSDLVPHIERFGMEHRRTWTDPDDWYAVMLFQKIQGNLWTT